MIDPSAFGPLPLLADGDPAQALACREADWQQPVEALNQFRPEAVQALHAEFAAAGARLLRTNTAQATAAALAPHGLAERSEAINNSGSALARRALAQAIPAGGGFVMGTLAAPPGPGLLQRPDWQRSTVEQIIYLSDTGVDLFLLQHCTRLADALALTGLATRASDAPVLAALLLDAAGRTADGHDAAAAGAALADAGAAALGLSCGPGPQALPACLDALLECGLPVAVLAGVHGGTAAPPYPGAPALDPAAFAAWLAPLAQRGVAILGGCCGVRPAHVRALAQALGRE